jgi:hypothetical protein
MTPIRRVQSDVDRVRVLMAEVAPVPRAVPSAGDAQRRLLLLERIVASPQGSTAGRARATAGAGGRRPARRLVLSGVAAASVLAIALLGVVQPWNTPHAAAALTPPLLEFEFVDAHSLAIRDGRPAAEVLRQLSAVAAARPTLEAAGPVQRVVTDSWELTVSQGSSAGPSAAIVPNVVETRVNADGSYTQANRRGAPLSADGRSKVQADLTVAVQSTDTAPAGSIDLAGAVSLSLDPGTLGDQLRVRAGCAGAKGSPAESRCAFRAISDLYAFSVIPPKVEAALWAALALDPNLVDLGRTRDRVGRDGVGVALELPDNGPTRVVLIIDPSTGHLLGREDLLLGGGRELGITTPAIIAFTAIVSSGWTY